MDINPIFFYVFAVMAIACSLLVILKKNPVASAFNLIIVFFSFAGIYALLGAHLIAALQVLVYAGAIMVLFVFVIMLLNADAPSFDMGRSSRWVRVFAALGCLALFVTFVKAFKESAPLAPTGPYTPDAVAQAGGNTQVVSELMFSQYILPFELTSVLLLGAMVGAVAMAKRRSAANVAQVTGGAR